GRLDVHDLDDPRVHPLEPDVPSGLEHDGPARVEEAVHQRVDALLLERLASGHLDEVRPQREDLAGGGPDGHPRPAVECVRAVAPDAAQGAAGETDERAGEAGARGLSLERAENLGDLDRLAHGTTWIRPCSMFMPHENVNSPGRSGRISTTVFAWAASARRTPKSGKTISSVQGLASRRSKT